MAIHDPGPGLPPLEDRSAELETDQDPAKVKKGAALWMVLFLAVGIWACVAAIGWLGAFGVFCLAVAGYFACIHTLFDKIHHYRQAVMLWNEVERMSGETGQAGGISWAKGPAPHEVCEECGNDIRNGPGMCMRKGCPYQRNGP